MSQHIHMTGKHTRYYEFACFRFGCTFLVLEFKEAFFFSRFEEGGQGFMRRILYVDWGCGCI